MAFVSYVNTGPFSNGTSPGISATFLNNVETFLDQIKDSIVADTTITTDFAGNLTGIVGLVSALAFSNLIKPNQAGTVVNGSVSGSISFFAPVWGTGLKIMIADMNNYQAAAVATFNFPAPALSVGFLAMGGVGATTTCSLFKGGVNKPIVPITTFGGAGAGADAGFQNQLHSDSLAFVVHTNGADQIQVSATGGAAWNAPILLIGV